MPKWKQGCTVINANKFQPDCCSSLVYTWLCAMKRGESEGETWCNNANKEAENSQFYAGHIARNNVIQGTDRIATVQRAVNVNKILLAQGFAIESFQIAMALQPAIDDLTMKKTETTALSLMGLQVVRRITDNAEAELDRVVRLIDNGTRLYTISVKAAVNSHIIGLVSTKSEGIFANRGWLYYYDPNLKCVAKFSSRDDLMLFIQTLESDYNGIKVVATLR